MKAIFFSVFLLNICFVFAQRDESTRITNDYSALAVNSTGAWIANYNDDTIDGSVYLYDNWKSYAVLTTQDDDKKLVIRDLNFNTKQNNFVVKITNDSVYVFDNSIIKAVRLNNKNFKEYTVKGKKRFLEVIAFNSNYEILKGYDKVIKKGKLNPLTQITERDHYVTKEIFYFKKGNSIRENKLNKNAFIKLFGKDANKVRDFINDNHLNVKDEKRIQTILNFQNTL